MSETARPTPVHGTVPVRDDHAVPVAALREWLSVVAPLLLPAAAAISLRQFPAGFSNLTYLLTVHLEDAERVYVLRRPPPGAPGGVAHDMPREHGILVALTAAGVPVPTPLAVCPDAAIIGAPFYVMAHVEGLILRGTLPPLLAQAPDAPARLAALSHTCASTLAQVHAVPVTNTPLEGLGRAAGYGQRQVTGWTRRWQAARTHDVPAMDRAAAWLAAHVPPERDAALIHNDFKLDNLVLEPDASRVRAILDWEMATIGDPLMDLGTTLAYWVEAGDPPIFRTLGLGVTALPGAYSRDAFVSAYADARGIALPDLRFHVALGRFKVAVIAQQIYARFVRGLTDDPRFARLGEAVEEMARLANDG